jgi:hypothetical protein
MTLKKSNEGQGKGSRRNRLQSIADASDPAKFKCFLPDHFFRACLRPPSGPVYFRHRKLAKNGGNLRQQFKPASESRADANYAEMTVVRG